MDIAEADWKKFKKVRRAALDRFSQRVLDESQTICADESASAHERYLRLYKMLQQRDQAMAQTFDDFRRSTALICLNFMISLELLSEEELSEFSPSVRNRIRRK